MKIIEKLRDHDYGSVAIAQDGKRYYVVRKSAVETEWVAHKRIPGQYQTGDSDNSLVIARAVDGAITENANVYFDACNVMFGKRPDSPAGVLLNVVDTLCENEFGVVARITVLTGRGEQCDAYARKHVGSQVWLTIFCTPPSTCVRMFRADLLLADQANQKEFLDKFTKAAGL